MDRESFYKGVSGHSAMWGEQDVDICKCCGGADEHAADCIVPVIEAQLDELWDAVDKIGNLVNI